MNNQQEYISDETGQGNRGKKEMPERKSWESDVEPLSSSSGIVSTNRKNFRERRRIQSQEIKEEEEEEEEETKLIGSEGATHEMTSQHLNFSTSQLLTASRPPKSSCLTNNQRGPSTISPGDANQCSRRDPEQKMGVAWGFNTAFG